MTATVRDDEDALQHEPGPDCNGGPSCPWLSDRTHNDEQPDREPSPADEEAWDAREDFLRGSALD